MQGTQNISSAAQRIEELCAYIRAHATTAHPLRELAKRAGMSPFHFQRTFKQVVGVTPRQFAQSCRVEALKANLRSEPVTHAIYAAGFGSSSRVYESSDAQLGMTPATYGLGGQGAAISYGIVDAPVGGPNGVAGKLILAATDRGLCLVHFGESARELEALLRLEFPNATISAMPEPHSEPFAEWMFHLREHVRTGGPSASLPLDLRATAFQMKVWNYLRSIPSGSTQSYAEVAAGIGQPTAARAVARACATNDVAIAIPCHRVIRGTGQLSGYRWGLDRKLALLAAEARSR